jgi:hypothetical protein
MAAASGDGSGEVPDGPIVFRVDSLGEEQAELLEQTKRCLALRRPVAKTGLLRREGVVLKFLVARQFHVEEACDMLLAAEEWFEENRPQRLLLEAESGRLVELERKKTSWWQHRDNFGRPVLIGYAARHLRSTELADKINHTIHCLEEGARRCRPAEDGVQSYFIVLLDMSRLGWDNIDVSFYSTMAGILQNFYPERVGAFYVCSASWKAQLVWKTVRSWLDSRTCSKIFVNPSMEQLERVLPREKLPIAFGGLAHDPHAL